MFKVVELFSLVALDSTLLCRFDRVVKTDISGGIVSLQRRDALGPDWLGLLLQDFLFGDDFGEFLQNGELLSFNSEQFHLDSSSHEIKVFI